MDWELCLYLTLGNYILSWLLVEGHIFDTPRHIIQRDTPFLRIGGVHLLECRTCVGFWVAAVMAAATLDPAQLLPVWAGARILARQERPVDY